jgi:hypothetical protein
MGGSSVEQTWVDQGLSMYKLSGLNTSATLFVLKQPEILDKFDSNQVVLTRKGPLLATSPTSSFIITNTSYFFPSWHSTALNSKSTIRVTPAVNVLTVVPLQFAPLCNVSKF